ncbi:MAG: sialidase family protein [Candidatus Kapabacteria bacterium]|nr:sialidase family protein [Candidatus Kapabacteria bacterium]
MRCLLLFVIAVLMISGSQAQHVMRDVTPTVAGTATRSLSIAAWGDDTVMAMTSRGVVFHSVDAGLTWGTSLMPPIDTTVNEIYSTGYMAQDGTVFACATKRGNRNGYGQDSAHTRIYRSRDKGLSWVKVLDTAYVQFQDLSVGPSGELVMAAILYSGPPLNSSSTIGLISSNENMTWAAMSITRPIREVEWAPDDAIYCVTNNNPLMTESILMRSGDRGVSFDSIARQPSSAKGFNFAHALESGIVLVDLGGKILSVNGLSGDAVVSAVPFDTVNALCVSGMPFLQVDEVPDVSTLIHAGNAWYDLAFSRDDGKTWTLEPTTKLFDPWCGEEYSYVVAPTRRRAWISSVGFNPSTFEFNGLLRRVDLDLKATSISEPEAPGNSPLWKLLWMTDVMGRHVDETFRGLVIRVMSSPTGEITVRKEWQRDY